MLTIRSKSQTYSILGGILSCDTFHGNNGQTWTIEEFYEYMEKILDGCEESNYKCFVL